MPVSTEHTEAKHDHVVRFYESDDELVAVVGDYLVGTLRAGDVAVIVATQDHAEAFQRQAAANGADLEAARADGSLVVVDAGRALEQFMVDGRPDPEAFHDRIGDLLQKPGDGRAVRVYGEMVALLWDEGNVVAAIELEALWNDLGRALDFSLLCAYPRASMADDRHGDARATVCRLHGDVVGATGEGSSWDLAEAQATRRFPCESDAPRRARHFAIATLEHWGQPPELVDDVCLLVSELATNAVIHGNSDFVVTMSRADGVVRCSVSDHETAPPRPRVAQHDAPSGRGLLIVDTIAVAWGVTSLGAGKVVWADLPRGAP